MQCKPGMARNVSINFRIKPEVRNRLEALAEADRIPLSVYLRRVILDHVEPREAKEAERQPVPEERESVA